MGKLKEQLLTDPARTAKIRQANDLFRTTFVGGLVVVTAAFVHADDGIKKRVLHRVRTFDDFTDKNDPHGEHDFGAFNVDGERYFFKIDPYDKSVKLHSPDAADPDVTTRVLTVGFMSDY